MEARPPRDPRKPICANDRSRAAGSVSGTADVGDEESIATEGKARPQRLNQAPFSASFRVLTTAGVPAFTPSSRFGNQREAD